MAAAEMNAPSRTRPVVQSASAASSVKVRLLEVLMSASARRRTVPASVSQTL
jgi:hypothetical protein